MSTFRNMGFASERTGTILLEKNIVSWIICGVHVIFTFVTHSGWSHISIWAAPYKYEWIAVYA